MAPAAVAAEPYADRSARARDLGARYLFAAELMDFYSALLVVQDHVHSEAISARPGVLDLVAYVAETAMPAIVDVTVAAGPQKLREAAADRFRTTDPRELVAAWFGGEEQGVVDQYLARASAGPVLEALRAEVASSLIRVRDVRHCPSCGGLPQLSYFAVPNEDLASGGRFLLCARCYASWGFARMTCPGCGEDSSARLPIFNEEGNASGERGSVVRGLEGRLGEHRAGSKSVFPHIRIEACETCRQYLLNIDLLTDPRAVPMVDEMAALPLDLYARETGFSKITPNLVGF
jgi:FdhE protein